MWRCFAACANLLCTLAVRCRNTPRKALHSPAADTLYHPGKTKAPLRQPQRGVGTTVVKQRNTSNQYANVFMVVMMVMPFGTSKTKSVSSMPRGSPVFPRATRPPAAARHCHGSPTQQLSVSPSEEQAAPPNLASRERRKVASRGRQKTTSLILNGTSNNMDGSAVECSTPQEDRSGRGRILYASLSCFLFLPFFPPKYSFRFIFLRFFRVATFWFSCFFFFFSKEFSFY